jgi:isopenicillin N synthase-like dioxygenase
MSAQAQKEGFMIGPKVLSEKRFLQGPNQWTSEADVPGFRETFMTYFSAM